MTLHEQHAPSRTGTRAASVSQGRAVRESSGTSKPRRFVRLWKKGSRSSHVGQVHVSMNDFLITHFWDIPRVAYYGLRFRRSWPRTEGALGVWFASAQRGRRQISVSVWESPEQLRRFVRTQAHLKVMRDFRDAGHLYTNAWAADRLDKSLIWQQAEDRLRGRVDGVSHH